MTCHPPALMAGEEWELDRSVDCLTIDLNFFSPTSCSNPPSNTASTARGKRLISVSSRFCSYHPPFGRPCRSVWSHRHRFILSSCNRANIHRKTNDRYGSAVRNTPNRRQDCSRRHSGRSWQFRARYKLNDDLRVLSSRRYCRQQRHRR
jgi:hypothetical protein